MRHLFRARPNPPAVWPTSSTPTKVTRTALQNAVSISSLLLTTGAISAEIPDKKEAAVRHNHGGGSMEGMY
jgi:chaperonin GroEL